MPSISEAMHRYMPGILVSFTIAMAAQFLSEHYGGPVMLFALLLGMAFHFLSEEGRCSEGIGLSSSFVLRIGVALLGARIGIGQVMALGWYPVALVIGSILATILAGLGLARILGLNKHLGLLTSGAVAICGASAAMAIASALPKYKGLERDTIFTVVGVTTLSTLAMILYPIIIAFFGLNDSQVGIFLGATIHDVAQVVGAGYMVSDETGDVATLTKLLRVAMLIPVVMSLVISARLKHEAGTARAPLPWFLFGFIAVFTLCNFAPVPDLFTASLVDISRWCLITAIAALGMKTSLGKLAKIGHKAIVLIVGETLFLAILVLIVMKLTI